MANYQTRKYRKGYIFIRPTGNIYRVKSSYRCNDGFRMYMLDIFGGPDKVLKGPLWKEAPMAVSEAMIDASTKIGLAEIKEMCAQGKSHLKNEI